MISTATMLRRLYLSLFILDVELTLISSWLNVHHWYCLYVTIVVNWQSMIGTSFAVENELLQKIRKDISKNKKVTQNKTVLTCVADGVYVYIGDDGGEPDSE